MVLVNNNSAGDFTDAGTSGGTDSCVCDGSRIPQAPMYQTEAKPPSTRSAETMVSHLSIFLILMVILVAIILVYVFDLMVTVGGILHTELTVIQRF